MVTLIVIAVLLGLLLLAVSGVCAILLDPIIAILTIYGLYKLIKWVCKKLIKKKK